MVREGTAYEEGEEAATGATPRALVGRHYLRSHDTSANPIKGSKRTSSKWSAQRKVRLASKLRRTEINKRLNIE